VLSVPLSLGVAKLRIRFTCYPQYVSNITSDLHVQMEIPANGDEGAERQSCSVNEIFHSCLREIMGDLPISLYIFFPRLGTRTRGDSETNFPRESIQKHFFDRIWLPALSEVLLLLKPSIL
jgi:hypothetical protein